MNTKLYHLRLSVQLTPRINNQAPDIELTFNDHVIFKGALTETTTFDVDQLLPAGEQSLSLTFTNKRDSDTDTATGADKAVIIDSITLNDISSPKFVWEGVYCPVYPEPWASEQAAAGNTLEPLLKSHNYLGWNGKWTLTFTTPVFTWVHNLENLGWIYG